MTPEDEARFARLELVWRALSPTGASIVCAVYATDGAGVEVRVVHEDRSVVNVQRAVDLRRARQLAESWRLVAIEAGYISLP